ncbi:MAG: NAD-binding protein [Archaeoglobaceae archaeon]|nr:NAD-binding protein [Archaeoglobaceae archaeon]
MDIIVGGGKFGVKAVEYLLKEGRDFLVLDKDPNCEVARNFDVKIINVGAEKLGEIVEKLNPEWIFPTAPLHVAAETVRNDFEPWNEGIEEILIRIPKNIVVSSVKGSIFLSYNRDKRCPPNCIAPEICPITKIKREKPMFELLSSAFPEAIILISHQLAPGLGAIKGSEFVEFIRKTRKVEKIIVATACRCHGVITPLKKSSSKI